MGSASFHVEGRGYAAALSSSSHGAGRLMSRSEARRRVSARTLEREAAGVWFDHRMADRLREEAPSAYKDIGAVMRAQRDLVKVGAAARAGAVVQGRLIQRARSCNEQTSRGNPTPGPSPQLTVAPSCEPAS